MSADLLREARTLLDKPPSAAPGLWERAAVLLARQALEEALDGFWANRSPDLRQASMRAQLLCLGVLMNNERDAADVDQLWGRSRTSVTSTPAPPRRGRRKSASG